MAIMPTVILTFFLGTIFVSAQFRIEFDKNAGLPVNSTDTQDLDRFLFGNFLPLPNVPIPAAACATQANCCRYNCAAITDACNNNAATPCRPMTGAPDAAAASTCRFIPANCAACSSFACTETTACSTTVTVCAVNN